jgi:hypothetical protein
LGGVTDKEAANVNIAPQAGDIVKLPLSHNGDSRTGIVVRIDGFQGHDRHVVRWEDGHESLLAEIQGTEVIHKGGYDSSGKGRDWHPQIWAPTGEPAAN